MQRDYYLRTATDYEELHPLLGSEHQIALDFMLSQTERLGIRTILDIGSGTGMGLRYIKQLHPGLEVMGIEPVAALRKVGYVNGLTNAELVNGDATSLPYEDGSFDLVCEFATLHHIKHPDLAVAEMLRVARKAIFISDSNNFGQGSFAVRSIKQIAMSCCLWEPLDFIKTKGKGHIASEGDGLAYSYSVFQNYKQIREQCKCVHFLNTMDAGWNLYRTASHVALLGIKRSG